MFPRSEVFELPTIFTNDPVSVNLAMYDLFETELKADYTGLEVLFLSVHAGNAIHMRDSTVRSPSDLIGKKIRTPSRTGAWSIEALGGIPVAMPVPALPQSLQKGVVDGAFVPWEIIPALQLQHQTKFQIEGYNQERIGSLMFQTSMNKAKWDSLPEDIQRAFTDASGPEWGVVIGQKLLQAEKEGITIAIEAGNTHSVLSKEETQRFTDILSSVVDRWIDNVAAKNIDGEALVTKARKAIASHLNDT
ncbi:MAG: Solute-binding protein [SAR116 cluster bacterium]|nr:MAG: Solute-binding protein [SAR116 cluster bacterium]